ncbi:6621_t:CDS:1, partial [Paraglomus brasilianum]
MELKCVDTHTRPVLKGQKPDITFYIQNQVLTDINIISILEIKVTEKEDDWVQNPSIAQLCQFLETLLQFNLDQKE